MHELLTAENLCTRSEYVILYIKFHSYYVYITCFVLYNKQN